MKHLKLSRRELDEMQAIMGRDDRFRALFDHIAVVEAECAELNEVKRRAIEYWQFRRSAWDYQDMEVCEAILGFQPEPDNAAVEERWDANGTWDSKALDEGGAG